MKNTQKSFLQKLIDFYSAYNPIRVGKESIYIDVKDLFVNAYYNYVKQRFHNIENGINKLNEYNLNLKESIRIV